MDEMVERVSRAVCALDSPGMPQKWVDENWQRHAPLAREVIKAMREPTHDMTRAGWRVAPMEGDPNREPDEYWRAMIDAALKD
jgi:hypothetical protein